MLRSCAFLLSSNYRFDFCLLVLSTALTFISQGSGTQMINHEHPTMSLHDTDYHPLLVSFILVVPIIRLLLFVSLFAFVCC